MVKLITSFYFKKYCLSNWYLWLSPQSLRVTKDFASVWFCVQFEIETDSFEGEGGLGIWTKMGFFKAIFLRARFWSFCILFDLRNFFVFKVERHIVNVIRVLKNYQIGKLLLFTKKSNCLVYVALSLPNWVVWSIAGVRLSIFQEILQC